MSNLPRILKVVFFVPIFLAVLIFVLENQQATSVTFLGWRSPEILLSLMLAIALLVGFVTGAVLKWFHGRSAS